MQNEPTPTATPSRTEAIRAMVPSLGLVVLGMALGIELLFVAYVGQRVGARVATRNLPTVAGQIESARLSGPYRYRQTDYYAATVCYRYTVDGKQFVGSVIGRETGDVTQLPEAMAALAEYKEGNAVTVHFDPAALGHSMLDVDFTFRTWAPEAILAGLVCLTLALALGIRTAWRRAVSTWRRVQ